LLPLEGPQRVCEPLQVFGAAIYYLDRDALRHIVGVQFANRLADCGKHFRTCLDQQQPFPAGLNFSLLAIDGFYLRDDVDAGGDVLFYEMAGDLAGFLFRARGAEDDLFVGHIETALGFRFRIRRGSEGDDRRFTSSSGKSSLAYRDGTRSEDGPFDEQLRHQ
jgi:hypothetical protein